MALNFRAEWDIVGAMYQNGWKMIDIFIHVENINILRM
jgi:hypothetical protein